MEYVSVPRKSHGNRAAQRNVITLRVWGPLSERHTSLCSRRRRGRYKTSAIVSEHDDGSADVRVVNQHVSLHCVPSFHGALGSSSIGFRTPSGDMKSRVGAMISQ